jgi:hypothetical protein
MSPLDAKTWGRWSAWLALAYAAIVLLSEIYWLVVEAAFRDPWISASGLLVRAAAPTLLVWGAVRTVRRQSGGLRLLSAAWGVALGVALAPLLAFSSFAPSFAHDTYYVVPNAQALLGLLVAVVGLALTVLHKEK